MVAMKKIAFAAIAAAASADQVAANCCPSLCGSSSKQVNTKPVVTKPVSTHKKDPEHEDEEDEQTAQDEHDEDEELASQATSALKSKVATATETGAPNPEEEVDSTKAFGAARLSKFYSSMEAKLGEKGAKGAVASTGAICCAGVSYALYASFGQAGMGMVKEFGSAFRKALPKNIQDKFWPQPVKELTKMEKVAHKLAQPVNVAQDIAGQGVAAVAAFAAKHADKTAEVADFAAKQYNKLPETPAALKNRASAATTVVGEKASQVWSQVPETPEQVSTMVGKAMGALPAWEVAQVFVKAAVTAVTAIFCLAKTKEHAPVMGAAVKNFAVEKGTAAAQVAQGVFDNLPKTEDNIKTAKEFANTTKEAAKKHFPATCNLAAEAKTAAATFVHEARSRSTKENFAAIKEHASKKYDTVRNNIASLRGNNSQQNGAGQQNGAEVEQQNAAVNGAQADDEE